MKLEDLLGKIGWLNRHISQWEGKPISYCRHGGKLESSEHIRRQGYCRDFEWGHSLSTNSVQTLYHSSIFMGKFCLKVGDLDLKQQVESQEVDREA